MIIIKDDIYSIVKDGAMYRVKRHRKIIGTFKLLMDAKKYMEFKKKWGNNND